MKPKRLRRIYLKENRANTFRFRSKSSELNAVPVGEPKIVSVRYVDRGTLTDSQLFQRSLIGLTPEGANAYLVGSGYYDNHEIAKRFAVQYYKIQVIH